LGRVCSSARRSRSIRRQGHLDAPYYPFRPLLGMLSIAVPRTQLRRRNTWQLGARPTAARVARSSTRSAVPRGDSLISRLISAHTDRTSSVEAKRKPRVAGPGSEPRRKSSALPYWHFKLAPHRAIKCAGKETIARRAAPVIGNAAYSLLVRMSSPSSTGILPRTAHRTAVRKRAPIDSECTRAAWS
jgi:hypothetical protein